MDENLIQLHMRNLHISREEAIQLIADDEAIGRGAKLFELDPELEEGAKKARRAGRKTPTAPVERKRKANDDKRYLIDSLVWILTTDKHTNTGDLVQAENVRIINNEREFTFTYNGTKYKVVLSCPRA